MRKIVLMVIGLATVLLTACDGGKLKEAESQNKELKNSLEETLATQDSLLALVNDITDGMSQIKELEKIISTPSNLNGDSESRKNQIRNDMIAIQSALQARRQRLEELEARLNSSSQENATLLKTVKNLKTQIAEQQTEISTLTNKLAAANIQIEELGNTVSTLNEAVDTLNSAVANEKNQREIAEREAQALDREVNACFYAVGSKNDLKKANIIETGFLRKTKIMKGDFDENYFTTADRRTLTKIALHSKKAKVLTSQPQSSYTLTDENGQKVLTITNPSQFWQLSNFLVIQID
ncbi:MAG: hypothetical protein NC336_10340 [Clostridium sp.]|nr:hypothetical protein [Clostridium sp.]